MRSLRGRLALGVTAAMAAVLGVSGVLVARYVDHSEREALDDRLARTAQLSRATAAVAIQEELPSGDRSLDDALRAGGISVRLILGGAVLYRTGAKNPAAPGTGAGLRSFTSASGRRYRTIVTTIRDEGLGGLVRLEATAPLRPLERRQAALERRLGALGLVALLIGAAASWFAGGLVLAPLRRLRLATTSIAEDRDLDRRVRDDDGAAEVRALAASFNEMLGRLSRSAADRERALDATRRFAADVGHELRTPLTAVQATLSAIARHPDLDPGRRTAMTEDALAEQRRLVELLDGLQALARGDAAPGDDAEVDLAELAAEVAADAGRRWEATVETVLPEREVFVRGWEGGLRLLVGNLVTNAVKHGAKGGRVRVTVQPARDAPPSPGAAGAAGPDPSATGAGPCVIVDDDGPGVPGDERARVFEPFVRLDEEAVRGSGLGLAIVAQQARHHGADVRIEPSPLGGARFVVAFPPVP